MPTGSASAGVAKTRSPAHLKSRGFTQNIRWLVCLPNPLIGEMQKPICPTGIAQPDKRRCGKTVPDNFTDQGSSRSPYRSSCPAIVEAYPKSGRCRRDVKRNWHHPFCINCGIGVRSTPKNSQLSHDFAVFFPLNPKVLQGDVAWSCVRHQGNP